MAKPIVSNIQRGRERQRRNVLMWKAKLPMKGFQVLQALLTEQQRTIQRQMIGREVSVLFEKDGRLPGQMIGKSDHLHAVHVKVEGVSVGDVRRVRIIDSQPNSLGGELI